MESVTKDRTNFLFLHKLLKAIGDSIVKVFIPLIVYRASNNMYFVILFCCLHYFLSGVLNILLRRFLQRYGVVAIFLSMIPIIAIQFVLSFCPMVWYVIVLLAVLNALNQGWKTCLYFNQWLFARRYTRQSYCFGYCR